VPRGSRPANIEIGARSRKLDAGLRRAREKLNRFGRKSSRDLKKAFSGVTRSLGQLAGFGGAAGLAMAARDVKQFEERLLRLRIQSGMTAAETATLRKRLRDMGDTTGVASDKLLGGVAQFVSLTGEMDTAQAALTTFAKVAAASGAEMEDIAGTAAALRQNLKIDPKDFEQAFSVLLSQGKAGAIELRELSTLMASLGSQFPEFGKVGVEGLADLGAAMQVVRQGFGSGSEAATGFMGMMTAFLKKSKEIKKATGVEVFTYKTDPKTGKRLKQARTIQEIVKDIARSKGGKDIEKMLKAMGRAEGARALKMLTENVDKVDELTQAGLRSKAVAEDYATYQQSSVARMNRSWERMKNTIARLFTPERIEKFARALETVADILGVLADNLKLTLAAIATAKVSPHLLALLGMGGGGVGGFGAGGRGRGRSAKSRGQSQGKRSKMGGYARGALNATIAGGIGYGIGSVIDEYTGASDYLAGIEDTTVRAGKYDPTGAAASRMMRAKQLEKEAFIAEGLQKLGMARGMFADYGGMFAAGERKHAARLREEAAKIKEWEKQQAGALEGATAAPGIHPALRPQEVKVDVQIKVPPELAAETKIERKGGM
jgi:TP901 family phage tail tape measure protein